MRSSIPSARRRRTSVCLRWLAAASLGGVVLGWSPSAHAEPVSGEPVTTVTFHGACGLLGLGGGSEPDAAEVVVARGSLVTFRNEMSNTAVLRLDGEAIAEVPRTAAAIVYVEDGPVSVSMELQCLVGQPVGATTVHVTDASDDIDADPQPLPDPPLGKTPPPGTPSDEAPVGTPSSRPASVPRTTPPVTTPETAASPEHGSADSSFWRSPPRHPGEPSGAWTAGEDATPAPTAAPDQSEMTVDAGAERAGRVTVEESATVMDSARASGYLTDLTEPTGGDSSIGLLALIATVCVVGVSAGAVRAIIAQRAKRPEWA